MSSCCKFCDSHSAKDECCASSSGFGSFSWRGSLKKIFEVAEPGLHVTCCQNRISFESRQVGSSLATQAWWLALAAMDLHSNSKFHSLACGKLQTSWPKRRVRVRISRTEEAQGA